MCERVRVEFFLNGNKKAVQSYMPETRIKGKKERRF